MYPKRSRNSLVTGTASNYTGAFERADCEEISGWVCDKHLPNSPVSVDLYDKKKYVTTIVADKYRRSLSQSGYGNGRHAFRIPTPPQFMNGRAHVLSIRVPGSNMQVPPTPRTIRCPALGK